MVCLFWTSLQRTEILVPLMAVGGKQPYARLECPVPQPSVDVSRALVEVDRAN